MSSLINLDDKRKEKEADRRRAMRLMEALSGIDEELLERSEGKTVVPFWRYSRQLAVCFACMVLGVCAVGVYSVSTSTKSTTQSAPSGFAADSAMMNEAAAEGGWSNAGGAANDKSEDMYSEAKAGEMLGEQQSSMQGENNGSGAGKTESMGTNSVANQDKALENSEMSTTRTDSEDVSSLPLDSREKITLKAAKEMERIGAYVPETIPSGYQFESARGASAANSYLDMSLCWCKGMDDIMLHITEFYAIASMPADVNNAFQKRIVDPAKPETYDVSLYEIPYGETVPEEYREIFDHPVFKEADFSLELVKARMKSLPDAGDTNTPRGNFAVLYDSGILVEFNGRGSAEEIWAMFQSIQP